jgi:hypothetical protein
MTSGNQSRWDPSAFFVELNELAAQADMAQRRL